MLITSTSSPTSSEVDEIFRTTRALEELTPRPLTTLNSLANNNRLAVIKVDQELAGWAAIEELTPSLSELGMVYIKPQFREASTFGALIREAAKRRETILLATYTPSLIRYATRVWGAKEISLAKVICLSRGKFITKRFSRESRDSIRARVASAKPRYALIERR